jgi:hypothetical protein
VVEPLSFHPQFWSDVRRCEGAYGKGWVPGFLIDLRDALTMGIDSQATKVSGYRGSGALYRWRWDYGGGAPEIEIRITVEAGASAPHRILGAYVAGLDDSGVGAERFFAGRLP